MRGLVHGLLEQALGIADLLPVFQSTLLQLLQPLPLLQLRCRLQLSQLVVRPLLGDRPRLGVRRLLDVFAELLVLCLLQHLQL